MPAWNAGNNDDAYMYFQTRSADTEYERMRITSTGNVGIGTTTPQALLDIQTTTSGRSAILIPRDTTANRPTGVNGMIRYNTTLAQFEGYAGGAWGGLASASSSPFQLNGTNAYYNGGNVGIGTSTPANTLDVNGSMSLGSVTGAAAPTSTSGTYSYMAGNTANNTIAANTTSYLAVNGMMAPQASDTSAYTRTMVGRAATVQNLYYLAGAANSSGKTNTITVMKNGVATGLTCSVSNVTTCNDTTHSFTVAPGDEIGIKIVTGTATNTAVTHSWVIELAY